MRITELGKDYVKIDEDLIDKFLNIERIHIIELLFFKPTERKIKRVLELYPKTNRYVISNEIRTYNYILKSTSKKYYVKNIQGSPLVTFIKKNNKILFDFGCLSTFEKQFLLLNDVFVDLLRNTEVIMIDQKTFDEKKDILDSWSGNVIIQNENMLG